jgi:hypothetical protein
MICKHLAILVSLAGCCFAQTQPFLDRTHPSKVFGQPRNYRIFLPRDYSTSEKRYPVIYYFHGHSDRYTLEHYDKGTDTVPKIAAFAAAHDAIVVSVDGYVARDYTGFYGGSPWDVRVEGGDFDFGEYFHELVAHIDSTYRTLTGRRHRGTSGLSMGGYMSLWLSARYPDLIGSASSFNPGPEFYVGGKGARVLWRPKDHVANHLQTMVRLIRASGDYISQYHEETRDAYARSDVDFEYRQDEYHRHWATSIGETFEFHMRAFANSALNNVPASWNHSSPYRKYSVWGFDIESVGATPGITYLTNVQQGGLRITTRCWAPDGPAAERKITIRTAPLYAAGQQYGLIDHNLATGETKRGEATGDADGRLTFRTDGQGHQISFVGPGTGAEQPVVLPVTRRDVLRLEPGVEVALPIRIYNPRGVPMRDVRVRLTSDYPTVAVPAGSAEIPEIASGAFANLNDRMLVKLTGGSGYFAPADVTVAVTYDGYHTVRERIPVLIVPEVIQEPAAFEILDGRTVTFNVFRQKGNQGGGSSIQRTVTEGRGNGNGVLEPGEEATIWVQMPQGMDPFDKNNWYRTKIHTDSDLISEVQDLEEQKQLEWTSAKERTSVIRLAAQAAAHAPISLLLENETWSYHFTPDVRYGREKLYQAFQLHTRHLHRLELNAKRQRRVRPK